MLDNQYQVKAKKAFYNFYRIGNDINGNPRYVVSWLSLGLRNYASNNLTKKAGLRKYKSKLFGGGFVFTSYNIQSDAMYFESLGLSNN